MMVDWQPGYRVFWRNLRDLISPPKLPPLKLTSKPVPVRPLWAKREEFSVAQGVSIGVHALVLLLILVPIARKIVQTQPTVNASLITRTSLPTCPSCPRAKTRRAAAEAAVRHGGCLPRAANCRGGA